MIITHEDLPNIRLKHKDQKIAYSGGVFDLFHVGHVDLLEHLSKHGDIVVVGITPDERVREKKGNLRPIIPESQRLKIVNSIKGVDYVFIAPNRNLGLKIRGHRVLKNLRPDYFIFGEEHPGWFEDEEWLNQQGTQLIAIPRLSSEVSTSQIIEKATRT